MSTLARHLNKPFGYTCQSWLAIDIADRFFSSNYQAWFSTSINPPNNGYSSNPLVIYKELDRIVQTNDFNHSRVEQLRNRLTNWIHGSSLTKVEKAIIIAEITSAPIPAYRPELWKINLSNIHISRLINLGQFPDEYQIKDLVRQEIEVIVK